MHEDADGLTPFKWGDQAPAEALRSPWVLAWILGWGGLDKAWGLGHFREAGSVASDKTTQAGSKVFPSWCKHQVSNVLCPCSHTGRHSGNHLWTYVSVSTKQWREKVNWQQSQWAHPGWLLFWSKPGLEGTGTSGYLSACASRWRLQQEPHPILAHNSFPNHCFSSPRYAYPALFLLQHLHSVCVCVWVCVFVCLINVLFWAQGPCLLYSPLCHLP